ncbi:adenosine deaminase/editase [Amylocarpus encephaloides]|uniref:Adenosine deaminase/editase n=1 Tax=Amylocarpus encephaloides TaxID=45428 RepID=A0A9P7YLS6_9HELO|nr:adenosine deaminase/editase [Amylocarpus encephaloides]
MAVSGDEIADVVLKQFETWEKKRRPLDRTNGTREWVPLSGIVFEERTKNSLKCVASATGMKCLPQKQISRAHGVTLHDWHAEILTIRSFNHFILRECQAVLEAEKFDSEYVRRRDEQERTESHFQPFALKDGIAIHMYCSEAPCGDVSMELTMAAQEDATPWPAPNLDEPLLQGRGYFSNLGITRRKPSRPDAPPTLSKSCTDKLALKQGTSLLSSLTSLLVSPENMYITSLVLPSSQLSTIAVERAFSTSGRLSALKGRDWGSGYAFKPFRVLGTEREFAYSRRQTSAKEFVPSNLASSWTPHGNETVIGGTVQGRKQFDVRGASRVCKRRMWRLAAEIGGKAMLPLLEKCLAGGSYAGVKNGELLRHRKFVKEDVRKVMGGWLRNEDGEDFEIGGVDP